MATSKKGKREKERTFINTTLSKTDTTLLDEVSYITEEELRKPSSEKIFHWLLNYSKRDALLLIMKREEMERTLQEMHKEKG